METYLVIFYCAAESVTKHAFLDSDTPDASNPLAWGLEAEDSISAVIDVAESAVDSIWIEEEQVYPIVDAESGEVREPSEGGEHDPEAGAKSDDGPDGDSKAE